jgi:hypothetical protein
MGKEEGHEIAERCSRPKTRSLRALCVIHIKVAGGNQTISEAARMPETGLLLEEGDQGEAGLHGSAK